MYRLRQWFSLKALTIAGFFQFLLALTFSIFSLQFEVEAQRNIKYCKVAYKGMIPKSGANLQGNLVHISIDYQVQEDGTCKYPPFRSAKFTLKRASDGLEITSPNGAFFPNSLQTGAYTAYLAYVFEGGSVVKGTATYNVIKDVTPPKVLFTAPYRSDGTYVSKEIKGPIVLMKADASDVDTGNSDIKDVKFYVGDVLLATDSKSPYEVGFQTKDYPNGDLILKVIASDTQLNERTALLKVKNVGGTDVVPTPVPTPVIDSIAPKVSITRPVLGWTISGHSTVEVDIEDDSSIVSRELYIGNTLLGPLKPRTSITGRNFFFYRLWTPGYPDGVYSLTAKATDAAGNIGYQTTVAAIKNTDIESPTAVIITPAEGSNLQGEFKMRVRVMRQERTIDTLDAINRVEFFVDGISREVQYATKYWSLSKIFEHAISTDLFSAGHHTLKAVAYDEGGLSGEHEITVNFGPELSVGESSKDGPVLARHEPRLLDNAIQLKDLTARISRGKRYLKKAAAMKTPVSSAQKRELKDYMSRAKEIMLELEAEGRLDELQVKRLVATLQHLGAR